MQAFLDEIQIFMKIVYFFAENDPLFATEKNKVAIILAI